MTGYRADMSEPGHELIKGALSLAIPADPSAIEPSTLAFRCTFHIVIYNVRSFQSCLFVGVTCKTRPNLTLAVK
jgi:hypothetical protein